MSLVAQMEESLLRAQETGSRGITTVPTVAHIIIIGYQAALATR